MFYSPISLLFFILFYFFTTFFFALIQIKVITLAFLKLGVPPHLVMAFFFFILLGSFINIPLAKIDQETMVTEKRVSFFGFVYRLPVWKRRVTILAINVGGALIPAFFSLYLLFQSGLYLKASVTTVLVTIIFLN